MIEDCEHLGPKFRVRDRDGDSDTVSCASCIADELDTLSVGTIAELEIERLADAWPD